MQTLEQIITQEINTDKLDILEIEVRMKCENNKELDNKLIDSAEYVKGELINNGDIKLDDEISDYDIRVSIPVTLTVYEEYYCIDNEPLRVYTSNPPQDKYIWFKSEYLATNYYKAILNGHQLTMYFDDNTEMCVIYDINKLQKWKWMYKI